MNGSIDPCNAVTPAGESIGSGHGAPGLTSGAAGCNAVTPETG